MHFVMFASIALAIAALYLMLAAAVAFANPKTRTIDSLDLGTTSASRRWLTVFALFGAGTMVVALAGYLFWGIYLPAQRLEEVTEINLKGCREKIGKMPTKVELREDGMAKWAQWKFWGTDWFGENEVWDFTVDWSANGWKWEARRRGEEPEP